MYFMVKQGSLYCGSCYPQFAPGGVLMNRGVTTALRHTIYADFNKVFSFTLPAKDLEGLPGCWVRKVCRLVHALP